MGTEKDEATKPAADGKAEGTPKTGDAPGAEEPKSGDDKGKAEAKFTQADLDRIVTERLERERQKQEKVAEDARKKAEEEALATRQEFEKLAEQRGQTIDKLKPELEKAKADVETLQSRVQALEEAMRADVSAELNGLNLQASVAELLKGKDLLEQRTWLTAHREELKKSRGQGAPPSPDPNRRSGGPSEAEKTEIERQYSRSF